MISRVVIVSAITAFLSLSGAGYAQVSSSRAAPASAANTVTSTAAGCPGGNGIHISATSGTLTDSSAGVNRVIPIGQSVDTTLVFDIARKTWTRTNLAAAISVGLADESRGRYAVCAGVSALLP